ncbi:DUF885 domain-containing protein [Actinopolymorpha pittospori]
MTPVFALCARYVTDSAALDPIAAGIRGVVDGFVDATDYGPDGYAARADLIRSTLAHLAELPVTGTPDQRAASHLRERLEAELAWHGTVDALSLRAQFGTLDAIRDSVEVLPHGSGDDWRNVAARLAAVPRMLAGWRDSLDALLDRGMPAARRQALETAALADRYGDGIHSPLLTEYADGPMADELAAAVEAAHAGYGDLATYLRHHYAPRATETDGVGAERYAVGARLSLGADLDPVEAYAWGWEELRRVEAEMALEVDRIRPGATVEEAIALLDETEYVVGTDAYLGWLQERHDRALITLQGTHFDIAEPLRRVQVTLAHGSAAGSAYYTGPSEDLRRPGRTWWPLGGRERFHTWGELTTVFHEGVPGHHLQIGACRVAGDQLSRFAKFSTVPGHSEGWALYAERLADELGWFTERGTRLGMLMGSAMRAARVVIDIGVHLDLPLPDGSRWTFDTACDVLLRRGRAQPHRVRPEIARYFGWPAQAISYKLGERAWLAAREAARARPDFDLRSWHTKALTLGPIGLDNLSLTLAELD